MFARRKVIESHDLPELHSPRLILRPLKVADLEDVYAAIDHSRVEFVRWFTWAADSNPGSVRQSLYEAHIAMVAGSEWHYAIIDRELGFAGRIGLSEIDQKRRSAELGYWLDTKFHGRGLMTEAVRLFLSLVLSGECPAHIHAFTDVENAISQRVLTKCGFHKIGSVVNAVHHPQRGWRDQYHFKLISE